MLYMAGTFLIYLLCVHRIIQSYVGEATEHIAEGHGQGHGQRSGRRRLEDEMRIKLIKYGDTREERQQFDLCSIIFYIMNVEEKRMLWNNNNIYAVYGNESVISIVLCCVFAVV